MIFHSKQNINDSKSFGDLKQNQHLDQDFNQTEKYTNDDDETEVRFEDINLTN